jgi:serine/threonine-protein kinase
MGVAATALPGVSATIGRPGVRISTSLDAAWLPKIALDSDGASSGDLVAVRVLGEGGMGIVHLASQRSLGREVAVKTARSADPETVRAIVREARLLGGLEHPNMVPVHALGRDASNAPMLVMKRVEGTSWRAMIHDDNHAAWAPLLAGHGDRLRAHVEIVMQVARALAFAHGRGVVHRDVKPDNVMIGPFGEVYLLDWGIALRLDERHAEPFGIAGTPGYIAPEMVRGDPHDIDARTDVYLLGATLFEALARRSPHDAESAIAALAKAERGMRGTLPSDTPTELAAIVDRAMALDPAARFSSAEAFRVELTRFLASRDADALARDGRAARARACELVASEGASVPAVFRALVESRFAFAAALRVRTDDGALRDDLDATLRMLADRDVALGNPDGARVYAGEMHAVPPELTAAIEAAEDVRWRERAAVEEAQRARVQADTSGVWWVAALVGVVVMTLALIWLGATRSIVELPLAADVLKLQAAIFAGVSVLLVVFRRRLFATAAPRRLAFFALLWLGITPAFAAAQLVVGQEQYQPVPGFLAALFLTSLEAFLEWRELWPAVGLHVVALVVLLFLPAWGGLMTPVYLVTNILLVVRALRQRATRSSRGA